MDINSAYLYPETKEKIYLEHLVASKNKALRKKNLFADWINQSTASSKLQKIGTRN